MLETAILIYLIAMSPVGISLNEKSSPWTRGLLFLTNSIAPVTSIETNFLYNSDFILFADLLYWKMTFCSSLENGHWSHFGKPELQTDIAAQPARISKCNCHTNRPSLTE